MSLIMAISKLIKTITETSKYEPKIILKAGSVHSGRSSGIGLISAFVVCPNTAKNKRSNAMNGVIVPFIDSFYFSVFDFRFLDFGKDWRRNRANVLAKKIKFWWEKFESSVKWDRHEMNTEVCVCVFFLARRAGAG